MISVTKTLRSLFLSVFCIFGICVSTAQAHHYTQAEIEAAYEAAQAAYAEYQDAMGQYSAWSYISEVSAAEEARALGVWQCNNSPYIHHVGECVLGYDQEYEAKMDWINEQDMELYMAVESKSFDYIVAQSNYEAMINH